MRVLQSIREAEVRIPLSRVRRAAGGGAPDDDRRENRRRPLGTGTYFLSYLDRDVLVGRAASGGVFIFRREEEEAAVRGEDVGGEQVEWWGGSGSRLQGA